MTKVQLMVFDSERADTNNVNDFIAVGPGRMQWIEAESIRQDKQDKIVISIPGKENAYYSFDPVNKIEDISMGFENGYIDFFKLKINFRSADDLF